VLPTVVGSSQLKCILQRVRWQCLVSAESWEAFSARDNSWLRCVPLGRGELQQNGCFEDYPRWGLRRRASSSAKQAAALFPLISAGSLIFTWDLSQHISVRWKWCNIQSRPPVTGSDCFQLCSRPDFSLHRDVLACVGREVCVLPWRSAVARGFRRLDFARFALMRGVPCSLPLIERKRRIRTWWLLLFLKGS